MRTSFLFAQRIALLTALLFGGMLTLMAQTPGIPYQAYFVDNNAGYVPGEQIKDIPLANTEILLEFEVRNDKGEVEYIERIPVKTDEFGLVSTIIGIGNGTPVLGSFSDIDWNGKPKTLYTDIDFSNTGNQFEDHGNMPIIYIPVLVVLAQKQQHNLCITMMVHIPITTRMEIKFRFQYPNTELALPQTPTQQQVLF